MASQRHIQGDLQFPGEWVFFAPFEAEDGVPPADVLQSVPETLTLGATSVEAVTVNPINHQYNFQDRLGGPTDGVGRMAYVFIPLESPSDQVATIGLGGDWKLQAWLNGGETFNTIDDEDGQTAFPPAIDHFPIDVELRKGANLLVVRLMGGVSSAILAAGGPAELRSGNFKSLLNDPFLSEEERWTHPSLRVAPGGKAPVDIGARLELFIDDYLLDGQSDGAERRLHHPVHRNVIMELDQPWESENITAHMSVVQDAQRVLLYYTVRPPGQRKTTALLESKDGIHFTRPNLGRVEFEGSTDNNLLFRNGPTGGPSGSAFAPFIDENPKATSDQRFKAVARPGFSLLASPDGINDWVELARSVIEEGPYDTQNLAFWDPNYELYAGYLRARPEQRGKVRDIRRTVSKDFIEWTEPEHLDYYDERWEHLYTNNIRPYFRAPHIYIATPARFVGHRQKVPDHEQRGISDAILMTSRDGKTFYRWEEGFLRPGPDWEVWTDRNNYPAWGMIQTGPDEISMYWTEHYRHPGMRIRRGTLRLDGFVSLHAGARDVEEFLTRPLIFDGERLEINYATSAIGTIRIELCDEAGEPLDGFSLADSDLIFGNEIAATVTWNNRSDLAAVAGRPVRLRIRLHDADLYSIRFGN